MKKRHKINLHEAMNSFLAFSILFLIGGTIGSLAFPKTAGIFYIAGLITGIIAIIAGHIFFMIKHEH